MRYYDLTIDGGPHFSSLASSGGNDPNAPRVKFTLEYDSVSLNPSASYVSIYGITLDTMIKANSYNGSRITLNGGFTPGLPLATLQSRHNGLLFGGIINAASGNWRGSEISLDLLMYKTATPGAPASGNGAPSGGGNGSATSDGGNSAPAQNQSRLMRRRLSSASASRRGAGPGVNPLDDGGFGGFGGGDGLGGFFSAIGDAFGGGFMSTPANLIHHLKPGQWLGDAITQTLTTAFPGTSVLPLLSQNLKLNYQDSGFYQNLQQIAGYWKQLGVSLGAKGGGSPRTTGIDTYLYDNQFIVTDWTRPWANVALDYTDLIGQPTWYAFNEVFFSSVLRADLLPAKTVSFPPVLFGTDLLGAAGDQGTAHNLSQYRQLIFNGAIWLDKVRHVGDSRSPDGAMWRTDCWGHVISSGVSPLPSFPTPDQPSQPLDFPMSPFPFSPSAGQQQRLMARSARRW